MIPGHELGDPKFPPPEKERKTHEKPTPQDKQRSKNHYLTRRGNSNVLVYGPIIRVLTVVKKGNLAVQKCLKKLIKKLLKLRAVGA